VCVLVSGLRGTTATIVILEEAAYIDSRVVERVIVPLMGVDKCKLIGLSSPDTCENYYSQLSELKEEDGQYLFRTIHLAESCIDCYRAGVNGSCPHVSQLPIASWKPPQRVEIVRRMMTNQNAFLREAMGIAVSDNADVFDPKDIEALKNRPLHRFRNDVGFQVDYLFMVVDPSGGGTQSEFVAKVVAYDRGMIVVSILFLLLLLLLRNQPNLQKHYKSFNAPNASCATNFSHSECASVWIFVSGKIYPFHNWSIWIRAKEKLQAWLRSDDTSYDIEDQNVAVFAVRQFTARQRDFFE
jgi:hypothetical protein